MAFPARAPAPALLLLRRVLWPFVGQELASCTVALGVVGLLALSHLLPLG